MYITNIDSITNLPMGVRNWILLVVKVLYGDLDWLGGGGFNRRTTYIHPFPEIKNKIENVTSTD